MTKKKKRTRGKGKKTLARGRIKKGQRWCAKCLKAGRRVESVKYASGARDSYCRLHKNDYQKRWMKKKRTTDPTYGEPPPRGQRKSVSV
jgi:hypothetical protein